MLSPLKAFLRLLVPRLFASLLLVVAALGGPWIQNAPATSGHLHVSPGNLEFQTVVVGHTTTLTFQIKNTRANKLCIYHLYSSKGQFTVSGPSTPVSIFPSKSVQFRVTFRPSNTGKTSALLEIVSSAQAMVSFTMTGNAEAPFAKLQLSPTSVNFGSVNVSSGNSKTASVKNTGDIPLKISGVIELGRGFGFSYLSAGVLLAPNQQHVFQVSFRPQSKGTISGRISILSASLSSPTTLSLVGVAPAPPPPPAPTPPAPTPPLTPLPTNSSSLLPSASSTAVPGQLTIHLGWVASGSPVVGYRVHRAITMGGPYPNYTSDPLPTLDYIDTSAAPGATHDYVVTSIDSSGAESAYSNKVSSTLTTTASASASGLCSSTLDSPAISASPQQTTSPVQLAPLPVIHLSWTPSESAVAGYRVYRSLTQSGPYVDYDPGSLDALSFDDSSVVPGATYFYVVTPLDSEGDVSIYSNQAMTAPRAR